MVSKTCSLSPASESVARKKREETRENKTALTADFAERLNFNPPF
jgi:hypothetical protein